MTLSPPAPRKLLHTRSLSFSGYQRKDNLWDIEAHLTDIKTYTLDGGSGEIAAGTPLHEMFLRVTMDDNMEIIAIESSLDHYPLPTCPEVSSNYQSLVGLKVGRGWRDAVRKHVGGTRGCTHITEMFFPLATVAIQTIGHALSVKAGQEPTPKTRPRRLDGCYSWATDSPAVKKYHPEYYTGS